MAAVLITILKITGIVLASVVALVLIIAAIVLFVPIRYRIRAERSSADADLFARINATFLLHMLNAGFEYSDGTDSYIKLFGIRLKRGKKSRDEEEIPGPYAGEDEIEQTLAAASEVSGEDPPVIEEPGDDDYTIDWNIEDEGSGPGDINDTDSEASSQNTDRAGEDEDDPLKDDLYEKVEKAFDAVFSKIGSFSSKYDNIKKNIHYWDKMIHDERNREAAAYIKDILVRFLKRIAPKKVTGFVSFGFEDPETTGRILTYLAMIYPVLPRKFSVIPSFEEEYIYGKCDIKGRLALIYALVYFLKLYFNKDIKRMYRLYKRHSEK